MKLLVPLCLLAVAALPAQNPDFDLTTSTWLGGTGDENLPEGSHDAVYGAVILSDGRIAFAANLFAAPPGVYDEVVHFTDGRGAILITDSSGTDVLSLTWIAERVYDLALDAEDNLYVAAGTEGAIKLDPDTQEILWQHVEDQFVFRIDASPSGYAASLAPHHGAHHDLGDLTKDSGPGDVTFFDKDAAGSILWQAAHAQRDDGSTHPGVNVLDLAVDETTETIVLIGWFNTFAYSAHVGMWWQNRLLLNLPVDIPTLVGLPFDYSGKINDKRWELYAYTTQPWLDKEQGIPDPRFVNAPIDPGVVYNEGHIELIKQEILRRGRTINDTVQARLDSLIGSPREKDIGMANRYDNAEDFREAGITNNMADTRGYRVVVGPDGYLYTAMEVDGGNHQLLTFDKNRTERIPNVIVDGFHDNFYDTNTKPKVWVTRYELREGNEPLELANFGFTARWQSSNGAQKFSRFDSSDNTTPVNAGGFAVDEDGRVYFGSKSFSGLPLPGNKFGSSEYPRPGEAAFDPFDPDGTAIQWWPLSDQQEANNDYPGFSNTGNYTGGAFLVVMSPDFSKRLYTTRLSGGTTRAIAARKIGDQALLVWGGEVTPEPKDFMNKLHTTENAIQPDRPGDPESFDLQKNVDAFMAVVKADGVQIPAQLPQKVMVVFEEAERGIQLLTRGDHAYQLQGSHDMVSWQDIGDAVMGAGEMQTFSQSEGGYAFYRVVAQPQ